jgi:putative ABC transport system permease protein
MRPYDIPHYAFRALAGYPLRSGLILAAMAIGVTAVVLLSALGQGARNYVADQFTSLGTHLLIVLPGRSETTGGPPPLLGETPRDLTLGDALALKRSSAVGRVAPIVVGSAPVSHGGLEREVTILGSSAELYAVRNLSMAQGRFLPAGEIRRSEAFCVLGHTAKSELFSNRSALGQFIRIGQRRFRVIGVLAKKGESLGVDIGDVAIIPVASAQSLFNTESLFRILVQARSRGAISAAKKDILAIITQRHDGEDDITVITQDAMLATFDRILKTLTYAVAGIAAISLVVAGILVMNVMLIAISQRTAEIGLLKAIGARRRHILALFLVEAGLLALTGAGAGLLLAVAGRWLLAGLFPNFPITVPWWAPVAATATAVTTGLMFGWLPARRGAGLDPVAALGRQGR